MSKQTKRERVATAPKSPVFGHADAKTIDAIDRLADQMLMPRSWVVSQILKEWVESRATEANAPQASWNGSARERLGRHGLELPTDPFAVST